MGYSSGWRLVRMRSRVIHLCRDRRADAQFTFVLHDAMMTKHIGLNFCVSTVNSVRQTPERVISPCRRPGHHSPRKTAVVEHDDAVIAGRQRFLHRRAVLVEGDHVRFVGEFFVAVEHGLRAVVGERFGGLELAGGARLGVRSLFHRRFKAGFVHRDAAPAADIRREIQREARP